MPNTRRLLRFTAVLIFIAFFVSHQLISKKEQDRIFELRERLRKERYELDKELGVTGITTGVKVEYREKVDTDYERANATFVTLARNDDLEALTITVRSFEDRFNHKFHYDWVFMNNEEFTEQFKRRVSNLCSGKVYFQTIPKSFWDYPSFTDKDKAKTNRIKSRTKMMYGGSENYRFMCRFFSGFYYKLEILQNYEYAWRVEPETVLHCDVNYDVFKFMKENNKHYGFTITLREFPETIPTLWTTTRNFVELHPNYVHENNLLEFITLNKGKEYNLCHFWTNFEVINMNFLRSKVYQEYFDWLDSSNGFFYERWGDAPVHSIAVSLFMDRNQVHYFNDVGYYHLPMNHCPIDNKIWEENNCNCNQDLDVTFRDYSCTEHFYDVMAMPKPENYRDHKGGPF